MGGEVYGDTQPEGSTESPDYFHEQLIRSTEMDLNQLRKELNENPSQDSISVTFDLGEYKKQPEIKKLIADKESSVLMIQSTVDTAPHREKSDKLNEYVKNAQKIETYSVYFTPATKAFYEKNRALITEIANLNSDDKDLKNSKEWASILERYGDDVTNAEGGLNFILAFMRATDDVIFSKINKGEIGPNFNIHLSIQKSKGETSRRAVFEVKLPKNAEIAGTESNLNMGLLNEVESDSTFWTRYNPDRFSIMFQGKSSKFGKMYEDLIKLKKQNPETFNYYPKYENALKITTENLAQYYSSFGAILPEAEVNLKEYSKILNDTISTPPDKIACWTTPKISKWLSNPSFVTSLNSSSVEPLLGEKGLLRVLYNNVFRAGKVSSLNENLFNQLTRILLNHEEYHGSKNSKSKIEQLKFNQKNVQID